MAIQTRWKAEGLLLYTHVFDKFTIADLEDAAQEAVGLLNSCSQKDIGWIIYYEPDVQFPYDMRPFMSLTRIAMSPKNLQYCIVCGDIHGALLATAKLLARMIPKLHYVENTDEFSVLLEDVVLHGDHSDILVLLS